MILDSTSERFIWTEIVSVIFHAIRGRRRRGELPKGAAQAPKPTILVYFALPRPRPPPSFVLILMQWQRERDGHSGSTVHLSCAPERVSPISPIEGNP